MKDRPSSTSTKLLSKCNSLVANWNRRKSERPQTAVDAQPDEYCKLFKKLGRNNNNKDVRQKHQSHLDEYLENSIGPYLWASVNPSYLVEKQNYERQTVKVETQAVDKIYFRKADWISKFAEAMQKDKAIMA